MFVVIEGPDGVGKTSMVQKVVSEINLLKNYKAISVRFPGETELGKQIRERLLFGQKTSPLKPMGQTALIISDFHLTMEEVVFKFFKETMSKGIRPVIVSDRYYFSTYVYQFLSKNIPINLYSSLYNSSGLLYDLPVPDLTFFLSADYDIIKSRLEIKHVREGKDFFESESLKERIEMYDKAYTAFQKDGYISNMFTLKNNDISSMQDNINKIVQTITSYKM